jgi:hypothetical protein
VSIFELYSCVSGQCPVVVSCEHGNEPSGYLKDAAVRISLNLVAGFLLELNTLFQKQDSSCECPKHFVPRCHSSSRCCAVKYNTC